MSDCVPPTHLLSLEFSYGAVYTLIVFPTVGLLSGDLVGLCQPLASLVRLGFGHHTLLIFLNIDITCQQARVAQTGAPITEQKSAFAAEGCCLVCVLP